MKPNKSLAIAYAVKRKAQKKSMGSVIQSNEDSFELPELEASEDLDSDALEASDEQLEANPLERIMRKVRAQNMGR